MMPGRCPQCGKYGMGCDRSKGCYECGYGRRSEPPKPIEMTPEGLEALDDGGACTTGSARNKLPEPPPDKATEIYLQRAEEADGGTARGLHASRPRRGPLPVR